MDPSDKTKHETKFENTDQAKCLWKTATFERYGENVMTYKIRKLTVLQKYCVDCSGLDEDCPRFIETPTNESNTRPR